MQEYIFLTCKAFTGFFTRPFYRHDVVEQFDLIGFGSLTVVLLAGLFTGAALASQTGLTLDQFGARPVVGRLVSASMVKELGPVLTALMLTGRIGSGIAAGYGSPAVPEAGRSSFVTCSTKRSVCPPRRSPCSACSRSEVRRRPAS